MAKFDPFLPLDCAGVEGRGRNPSPSSPKGQTHSILKSGYRRLATLFGGRPQEGEQRGEDLQLALDRAATVRASVGDGGVPIFGGGLGEKEGRPVGIAGVPSGGTATIR